MSRISEEQKLRVIDGIKQYGTKIAGARLAGVSVETVRAEQRRSAKFDEKVKRAMEEGRGDVGETAMQVIESIAFHKNDPNNPTDKVDKKTQLTAATILANAFIPGFKGTTTVQGKIEHDVNVKTAVPRPDYTPIVDSPEVKLLPSPDDKERAYMRVYMRKRRAKLKADNLNTT